MWSVDELPNPMEMAIAGASEADAGPDILLLLLLVVILAIVVLSFPIFRWRKKARIAGRRRRTGQPALEPGTVYVISNEGPDRAFQIFADEVGRGAKGLVLTRLYPEDVRRRYRLDSTTVLWLSRSFGEAAVNPTNLEALAHEIERFVSGKEDSIVLLDGLDYLLIQTDRGQVIRFVQKLVKVGADHKARLLLPLDPRVFADTDRSLILRDVHTL